MGRKAKSGNRCLIWIAALFLCVGSLSLSLFPAPCFSECENRFLSEIPAITGNGIADGSYTAALDTYAAERFPFRIPLRQARALLQIALGKQEVGGVILCRDGSLARRIGVNRRIQQQNMTALQGLAAQGFTIAIAPRRIDARAESLPLDYDPSADLALWTELAEALPSAITFPSLTEDAHWYRTDHHWSTAGAYAVYCQLGKQLGYTPYPESDFERETVSTSFYGTSAGAAGLPFLTPDRIELWHFANENALSVFYDGKAGALYDRSKLHTRDQYAVFQGGNHALTEITTEGLPTLLVIKDSFANSLLPFLARHFSIVALDPRYGDPDLSDLRPNRSLVLCGMQTLCEAAFVKTSVHLCLA